MTEKEITEEDIKQKNKELLKKYPWLTPYYVYTNELPEDYDYSYTWMDDIPLGWKKAFGDQMVEELGVLLEKYNYQDKYKLCQIKEKYGGLRWYDEGFPSEGYDEYSEWLDKYEELSFKTCIECGKPAKYFTKGWIMPICEDCAKKRKYTESELSSIKEED